MAHHKRVLLDGSALGTGHGAARALRHILPKLATAADLDPVLLTTEHGRKYLGLESCDTIIVPPMASTAWEQLGLPWHAKRLGARAIYTFRSLAPTWGPPTLLHFTDQPTDVAPSTTAPVGERLKQTYQRQLIGPGLRRAAVIATFTETIAKRLIQQYRINPVRIEVVGLGVDLAIFHPDREPSADIIFHLGSDAPRDETIGVVQAYAQALKAAPDLPDLLIAGDLGLTYAAALRAAQAGQIEKRVQFLGRVTDSILRSCFARAAFCIQPSRYEGFGLIPLEAIACGAPTIVRDEPAVREVIRDAALIVGDSSPTTLAAAMRRLWAQPQLRAELRSLGLARAETFTWTHPVNQLHIILKDILNRPQRQSALRGNELRSNPAVHRGPEASGASGRPPT